MTSAPAPALPSRPRADLAHLLHLAWPIVLSRSAQAVVGFCDAVMVAPLGAHALAAVTAGAMNTLCVSILPVGIVAIVQSFAAQLTGQGDAAAARRYGWYALGLSAVAGALALAAIPLVGPAVNRLDYAPDVSEAMTAYMVVRLGALAASVAVEALTSWFGGLGNTRIGMIANVVIMIANVGLNYLLIDGHFGFPALGVAGAAWASVIATWMGLGLLVAAFVGGIGAPRVAPGRLRLDELVQMVRFGLPSGLNWFLEFAAFVVFINLTVARLGTVTTAALLAVMQINSVSFMPAFGLATAGAILAGQAIGARYPDDVPPIARLSVAATTTWQVAVGAIYLVAGHPILAWFAPREATAIGAEDIVEVGALLLAISAAWQLFDAIGIAMSEVLRAAGDTMFPLVARLVLAWVLFVPGSYAVVAVYDGGGVGAMIAIVAYLAVLSFLLGARFASGAWRRITLTPVTTTADT